MNEIDIQNLAAEIVWDAVQQLPGAEEGEDEFGNRILQVYLGSCFSILPSGKYYTPFANSNVDLCELCGGTGRGPLITCPYCEGLGERDYFEYNNQLGLLPCHTCNGTGEILEACPDCDGLGSREAYLDQLMLDALDDYAEKFDCWITSGEGDPTDLYLGQTLDEEEFDDERVSPNAGVSHGQLAV